MADKTVSSASIYLERDASEDSVDLISSNQNLPQGVITLGRIWYPKVLNRLFVKGMIRKSWNLDDFFFIGEAWPNIHIVNMNSGDQANDI